MMGMEKGERGRMCYFAYDRARSSLSSLLHWFPFWKWFRMSTAVRPGSRWAMYSHVLPAAFSSSILASSYAVHAPHLSLVGGADCGF
jgi:hypothetical protein